MSGSVYEYPYFLPPGLAAARPAATVVPRNTLYWATDTNVLSVSDGAAWHAVGGGGFAGVSSITSADDSIEPVATGSVVDLSVEDSPSVGGITVTGTPDVGDVPTATSPTTATWQDTSGGPPFLSGSGSPVGSAAATSIGQLYIDTTNGALWIAGATGSADWFSVGGFIPSSLGTGVQLDADASSYWEVKDLAAGRVGLIVTSADAGGTTNPSVGTANNTLDDGNTGAATFQGAMEIDLTAGQSLTVKDSGGNPIFEVREDATVHIKTGQTVVADL